MRLGAGKHLAYDVSHNNLIVYSSDGSRVPEDDDWSADGGPATRNIVAEAAAEAGVTCLDPSPSTRGDSSLSADLLRPPPPPAAEDKGSDNGSADAIDHALQANSAHAHFARTVEPVAEEGRPPPVPPHTPIPPAQLGPRTQVHVDHTSTDPTPMAGWAPRHDNDTHRLGVLNPDLDAWVKADRGDLNNYRKFGALQSISKSDLPAGRTESRDDVHASLQRLDGEFDPCPYKLKLPDRPLEFQTKPQGAGGSGLGECAIARHSIAQCLMQCLTAGYPTTG